MRTVTIKYEELQYVPRSIEVEDETKADEIFQKLKKRNDVRNLRRL